MRKSLLIIVLLVSMLVPVCAAAPPYKTYNVHYVYQVPDGKWITEITIVSWETNQPNVYRVTASYTLSWVGSEDMWVQRIHYKGTSSSWSSISHDYLITGMMEYTLQYTVFGDPAGDDGYDGTYRLWFEDGQIVRQDGSGYLWIP